MDRKSELDLNGDWGLGIGDWAIPNPQSPIPKDRPFEYFPNRGL